MIQLVQPNTGARDFAGWCHRFARAVFNAPLVAGLDSATKAANATEYRHHTRAMPDVAVPLWFDHDGDYDGTGVKNWGHVVVYVPGAGFLSSPGYAKFDASGREIPSQEWFASIEAVERTFNARFRFWSEDINGLRVAQAAPSTGGDTEEEEEVMSRTAIAKPIGGVDVEVTIFEFDSGWEHVFTSTNTTTAPAGQVSGQVYNRNVALAYGCPSACPIIYVTAGHYDKVKSENKARRESLAAR